jgi:hypothetical protein
VERAAVLLNQSVRTVRRCRRMAAAHGRAKAVTSVTD